MKFQFLGTTKPIYKVVIMITLIAAAAIAAMAGTLMFTPGSGVIASAVVARAAFVDPTDIKIKIKGGSEEVLLMPAAKDTVVQQIKLAPGGYTGWHSHPGPVIVLIKSGELTFYDSDFPGCPATHTYTAGQSFVDSGQGHVHNAKNTGSTDMELWAVYLDVPPGGAFRNDIPAENVPAGCPVVP